jgi:hypothetical protein
MIYRTFLLKAVVVSAVLAIAGCAAPVPEWARTRSSGPQGLWARILHVSSPELKVDAVALVQADVELARTLEHPVDDCVYLTLAERERIPLVSADTRFLATIARRHLRIAVVDLAEL